MKTLLRLLCALGLLLSLVSPFLAFSGSITEPLLKHFLTLGMLLWFAAATPLFLKQPKT